MYCTNEIDDEAAVGASAGWPAEGGFAVRGEAAVGEVSGSAEEHLVTRVGDWITEAEEGSEAWTGGGGGGWDGEEEEEGLDGGGKNH